MNIKILEDLVIEHFSQLNISQPYEPATFFKTFFKRQKCVEVDKELWVSVLGKLYNETQDWVFVVNVSHLYSVSNINFFPIDKNRLVYFENASPKTYLFSIKNVAELTELIKLYCEDYMLNIFVFNKAVIENIRMQNFLNFNNNEKDENAKLISVTDMTITFGANAETLSILYRSEFFEKVINPLIIWLEGNG